MAWKNILQNDISDLLVRAHSAFEELDGVIRLIDWREIEKHLIDIHNKTRGKKLTRHS